MIRRRTVIKPFRGTGIEKVVYKHLGGPKITLKRTEERSSLVTFLAAKVFEFQGAQFLV